MLERSPVQATESSFDEEGSYIQNKTSGEVTRIKEVVGLWELTMCVRKMVFSGKAGCKRSKEHAIVHSNQTEACKTSQFESLADGAASRQDDGRPSQHEG